MTVCIVYTYTILVVAAHHFIGVVEDDGMISGSGDGDGWCWRNEKRNFAHKEVRR